MDPFRRLRRSPKILRAGSELFGSFPKKRSSTLQQAGPLSQISPNPLISLCPSQTTKRLPRCTSTAGKAGLKQGCTTYDPDQLLMPLNSQWISIPSNRPKSTKDRALKWKTNPVKINKRSKSLRSANSDQRNCGTIRTARPAGVNYYLLIIYFGPSAILFTNLSQFIVLRVSALYRHSLFPLANLGQFHRS